MTAIPCARSYISRCNYQTVIRTSSWRRPALPSGPSWLSRRNSNSQTFQSSGTKWSFRYSDLDAEEELHPGEQPGHTTFWREFKGSYNLSPATLPFETQIPAHFIGTKVATTGFLLKITKLSEGLVFAVIGRGGKETIQVLSKDPRTIRKLLSIQLNSAVSVRGQMKHKFTPKISHKTTPTEHTAYNGDTILLSKVELEIEDIRCLNTFDSRIPYTQEHVYRPEDRHLQIRFDSRLQNALQFRSDVASYIRNELKDFCEIETPILFKSTPEGAREFLVPTRKAGFAYALPQSPQQYKQILMASGVNKYMQFARCFRDEDLRADRQPEFTQVDLEMAWTDGEGVMMRVEQLIKALYAEFAPRSGGCLLQLPDASFRRMTYDEAMSQHGSDKPDLRIPGLIQQIDHIVPRELQQMITHLDDPIIECCKIRLNGDIKAIQNFVGTFFSTPVGKAFHENSDGAPGVAIFDYRRPVEGLQTFGFEGAEKLKELYSNLRQQTFQSSKTHEIATTFDEGDVILLQARERKPHSGGSTALGRLRLAIYKAAIAEGFLEHDALHYYLWVTDFPMFTAENGVDPGQGGEAGFSATHHPFTAPKTAADVDLLITDPLKAKADHYDLVVNGVELGGGSRRIHSAEMQKFIMRDVLKMRKERIADFSHLLKALSAGCPPHAGLALGFDRLIAVMCGTSSVKDVIAFPKSSKGDDMMVKSPRKVLPEELARYHLQTMDLPEDVSQGDDRVDLDEGGAEQSSERLPLSSSQDKEPLASRPPSVS